MSLVKVASVSQLQQDSVMEVLVGENPYAICNVGGKIVALNGICPHRGGPLGQGAIAGTNVVCPYHAWEFDCFTGENDYDPTTRVATHEVKIEGDDVYIQVP